MKRAAGLALLLAVVAAIAAWVPVAGGAAGSVRVSCGARAIDIYFWPHGHGYVSAYRFPARRAPNITVFQRGSVATKSFLTFLSASSFNYANTCDLATDPRATRWGGGPQKTVTASRRVRCGFPWLAQIKAVSGGGFRVLRGSSEKELVRGRIARKGSTLVFDSRYCKASAVPRVD
jgi:hypothetical protein